MIGYHRNFTSDKNIFTFHMNTSELKRRVRQQTAVDPVICEKVVESTLLQMQQALANGQDLIIEERYSHRSQDGGSLQNESPTLFGRWKRSKKKGRIRFQSESYPCSFPAEPGQRVGMFSHPATLAILIFGGAMIITLLISNIINLVFPS